MITELRRYRLKPDRVDSWLAFFEEALRKHEDLAIRAEYGGLDRETSTFVWLRSFEDEEDRVRRKSEYYGTDWWNGIEAFAMSHVIEYEVQFLDAAFIQGPGVLERVALRDPATTPPGANVDGPATGYVRSTATRVVLPSSGVGAEPG